MMRWTGVSLCLVLLGACERKPGGGWPAGGVPDGPPLSLRETYDQLRAWHAAGSYLAMGPCLDADSRQEVINFLLASDELRAANAGAQFAIAQACPGVPVEAFDLSPMTDAYGLALFSRKVEFVGQQEEGDRATVTVRWPSDNRLGRVRFERRDGHWVYVPASGGRVPVQVIRDVAGALNRVALVVSTGPRTQQDIEGEYRLRIRRRLERIDPMSLVSARVPGASGRSPAVPAGPPLSLRETYDRLREWHSTCSYEAMGPYIDATSRDEVVDLLVVMDELLAANAAARAAITRACPGIAAAAFDMSHMANALELFSRDVQLIRVDEEGNRGLITVQIARRLPLKYPAFERRAGHWVYVPGPLGRDFVTVIREMTGALNHLALVLLAGPRSDAEIEAEYRRRIGPKLEVLMTAGNED